jgi:large subunit ribosomal protein L15
VVNVADLEKYFPAGAEVTGETLKAHSLARGRYDLLKVLGNGELTKNLKVSAHRFSQSALEKIQKAGGEAVVLPSPAPLVRNKQKSK